jgi:hypothetical protein
MAEVLTARPKSIKAEFERGFIGMTRQPVALDDLLAAREALISEIVGSMPDPHRQFLVGVRTRRTRLVNNRLGSGRRSAGRAMAATESR